MSTERRTLYHQLVLFSPLYFLGDKVEPQSLPEISRKIFNENSKIVVCAMGQVLRN